jgi:hypothetical protein
VDADATRSTPAGEVAGALAEVLARASAGDHAVTGLASTLEAVACGVVCRLFLERTFRAMGSLCAHCGVMLALPRRICPVCAQPLEAVEVGQTMAQAVREAGGRVDLLDGALLLAERGGVAACLREGVPRGAVR